MDHSPTIQGMERVSGKQDKDQDLVRLGGAVRSRRLALFLSQEALADHAGIDRSHMGKIERGERNVTFLNIIRIAKAIQCKPSDLLLDADL
jgi:transcriptional regulator with XRE-family HTH domain